MGFLSSLFGSKQDGKGSQFQSHEAQIQNRARQLAMTPHTLAELRKYGVTDQSSLKLEYFFYTNAREKAEALAQRLSDLGYEGGFDHSAYDRKQFVVTGWTARMRMDEETVLQWTGLMCDLAFQFDCEFDGWGTNPQQAQ